MSDSIEKSSQEVIAVLDAPPETRRDVRPTHRTRTKREPNYHVIIWNDEEHTYEYVIEMLMRLFGHDVNKATEITIAVDKTGKGIAHTCHRELAELKRDQILAYGADPRMPLISRGSIRATIEPAPE